MLDALTCCCGSKTSAFLRTLKETGARSGEACKLKWIDIDRERSTITVNDPEKNSNPRTVKVSQQLVATLHALPRTHERIFGDSTRPSMESNFIIQRKNAAKKLQNPRINYIHFHTFRHWKATMEYHKTKDILHVMKLLGHKRIESTMLYTQLVEFESNEYASRVTNSLQGARALVEAGFDYVCDLDGYKLFRKRHRRLGPNCAKLVVTPLIRQKWRFLPHNPPFFCIRV